MVNGLGCWAWLLRGVRDLPRPEVKPVSPALAGGFLAPGPPGKSYVYNLHGIAGSYCGFMFNIFKLTKKNTIIEEKRKAILN